MAPSPRPVLVFDGDCGICTRLADVARDRVRVAAAIEPWQRLDLAAYGLTVEQCLLAAQFVHADGRIDSGERSIAAALIAGRPVFRPLGRFILLPGVVQLAGVVYRWVARNRDRLPGGTPACALPAPERLPTERPPGSL
jgi:predicted DCC family thiol-disulfide oxidoreductase YuxK